MVYLNLQEWAIKNPIGSRNIIKQLLQARERRLKSITKLAESNVSISLNEENTLTGTVYHKLPARPFSKPTSKRVVKH
jgi:hypothetical protein